MRPPWNRRLWAARRRWLLVATAAGSILVMALSAVLQAFPGQLNGNIAAESMTVPGKLPPPSKAGVLNILALGWQTRDEQGPGNGHDPGTNLPDTAMLIHLYADHTRAIVLSIPRDLIVYRPPCRELDGHGSSGRGLRARGSDAERKPEHLLRAPEAGQPRRTGPLDPHSREILLRDMPPAVEFWFPGPARLTSVTGHACGAASMVHL